MNIKDINSIPGSICTKDSDKYSISIESECIFPRLYKTKYPEIVYSQGYTGMCIPCSLALIKHIQVYMQTGENIIFNPIYIYANRNRSLYKDTDEGMNIKDGLDILLKKGISTINYISDCYTFEECKTIYLLHKQDWDINALHYKITEYHSLNTEKDIKYAIYKYGAVTAVIPKYSSLLFPTEPDGTSYIIMRVTDEIINKYYHQITIIGWYEDYWIIQNSWGKEYGANGIVYLPMKYPLKEVWYCI